ncbi:MAG TPA: hypothetical protein DDY49_01860 [Paenibacillaceae bacterium]|nr:hypothetical protein [Paenibacillaceae bacterium]
MNSSHQPLTEDLLGGPLSQVLFPDVYEKANYHLYPYFSRLNQQGKMELILIYKDIDEFSENEESQNQLEFSARESQWMVMLWAQLPGLEPIGYPFLFDTRYSAMREEARQLLAQGQVLIHYLAWEGNNLWYIYQENLSFQHQIEEGTRLFLYAYQFDDEILFEDEDLVEKTMNATELPTGYLEHEGLSIYLNYGALVTELGEEKAREKVMARAFQGIHNVKGAEYFLWVGDRKNNRLSITLTPGFCEEREHPLLPFFMFQPEFEKVKREKPGSFGDIPIVSVQEGILTFIEWNGG